MDGPGRAAGGCARDHRGRADRLSAARLAGRSAPPTSSTRRPATRSSRSSGSPAAAAPTTCSRRRPSPAAQAQAVTIVAPRRHDRRSPASSALGATVTLPAGRSSRCRAAAILSAQNGNVRMRHDLPRFIRMIEDGRVTPEPIITRRYRAGRDQRGARRLGGEARPQRRHRPERSSDAHLPAPHRAAPRVERRPVDGACPECGAEDARRVPRARRGRLVGRAQVPGVPASVLARAARRAFGSYVPLGLRIARGLMLGVDVGGTFTDVVAVRDGRIEVTKVPSERDRPGARRSSRAPGGSGVAGQRRCSTTRARWASTRSSRAALPKVAFLTTARASATSSTAARIWRPLDGQTDPSWRRSFGDAARPLVPRYLRRGVAERLLADGSVLRRARRGPGARRARGAAALRRSRASRSACSTPTSTRRTSSGCASSSHEVLGDDVAVSISSETSPLAKEYARASTTVIDVFMKLIFTALRAPSLDADLRELGFEGELNFADCAATLLPWRRGAGAAVPDRLRRAGRRHDLEPRLGEALGERQPRVLRRRRHLDRRLARRRRRAVRRQHLRARARPDHQRALDRDLQRRRRRGQHRLDLAVRRRASSGPRARAPTRDRRATAAAARSRRVTDACAADGHPRPRRLRRRRDAPRSGARAAARSRRSRRRSRSSSASAFALPHRGRQHRRGGHERRRPPRRRPARLHARRLRRGRADAPARRRSTCCRSRRVVVPPHPGLFSALGLLSTDLVYYDSPQRLRRADPRRRRRRSSDVLRGDGAPRCASVSARRRRRRARRSFDGRLFGQSWETPFVRSRDGPIDSRTMPAGRALPRGLRAALRQPLPVRPGAGRHLPRELVVPAEKVEFTSPASRAAVIRAPGRRGRSSCATSPTSRSKAAEYERERAAGRGAPSPAPR